MRDAENPAIDPVTVEIIRCGLLAITNEIDANICRTAYSPIVAEYKDYAVGILDPAGNLICQCTGGIPIFVADILGIAVKDGLAIYGEDAWTAGDIVITNHAGTIGQHLNNVVMYSPIFVSDDRRGRPVAFVAVVMHWMDIGGWSIGSVSNNASNIFQEGIQFRTVKLYAGGQRQDEMFRVIEYNTRFPEMVLGDVESQIAGCMRGCERVSQLIARYGLATFNNVVHTIWRQSEDAVRDAIRAVPDGEYHSSTFLDDDGITPGKALPVHIKVIVAGEDFTVDLSGLPPQVLAPINSGAHGGGHTCARIAFKYLFAANEPVQEASFRPLHVILPEGTILSASPTAAMGRFNLPLPSVIDGIVRALESAVPDGVAGGHYGTFSSVQFHGRDPATGRFLQCLDAGHGGWGADASGDGSGPFRTMAHGDTRTIPSEVQEAMFPLLIEEYGLRPDSGGPGEHRGGLGTRKRYRMRAPMSLLTAFERLNDPPWGVCGGKPAQPGNVIVMHAGKEAEAMPKGERDLTAGDEVLVLTGGGGGYGDPKRRSADALREDLEQGYVTEDGAVRDYGRR